MIAGLLLGAVLAAALTAPPPIPVPAPALDAVEPAVREQLGRQRARLDEALAGAGADTPALAHLYAETGLLYLAYHFREAALACLANARSLAPREFRWSYFAGVAHQEDGDLAAAAEAYGRARDLEPSYPGLDVRLGQVELGRYRLEEAVAAFDRALAHPPTAAAARFGLGRVAAARGQPALALEHFRAALALQPEASAVHYPLALAYRAVGDLAAAARHLGMRGEAEVSFPDPLVRLLEDARRGAMPQLERASRALREGRFAEAAEHFRAALAARPGDTRLLADLAAALVQAGDRAGAEAAYGELLAQEPANGRAHFELGALLLERGDHPAALPHLAHATRLLPELAPAHLRLGTALALAGSYEEAARAYERALSLEPGDREAHRARVQAWLRAGREAEARSALEAGLARLPDDGDLQHLLARMLAAASTDGLRDGARAVALATRLLEARPSAAHAETLAMAFAEAGRLADAAGLQGSVVGALEAEGAPPAALARARQRLALYREGKPCRSPWLD